MGSVSKFFTETYSDGDPLEITENMGVALATLMVLSGTCTIQGNYRLGAQESGPITLSTGKTVTLSSRGPGSPLDGITITPSNPGDVGVILQP